MARSTSTPQPTFSEAKHEIEARMKEKLDRERDKFDALYSEWLSLQSEKYDPVLTRGEKDEIADARSKRMDELARTLCTMPAHVGYQIMLKISILEHFTGEEGGTAWTDNREIVMLAGIKADLLRFRLTHPDEEA